MSLALAALLAAACGGSARSTRAEETHTANGGCRPTNDDRPFVVAWDATDLSSFEAHAAHDLVFVHFEGCEVRFLEGCADEAVRGAFGQYGAVQATFGSTGSIDIQEGKTFHVDYFVRGTRTATRGTVRRADLANIAACRDATHFVYAYNVGAFVLRAGAKAEKRLGDMAACRGESSEETRACSVPIRLTLRAIDGT